MVEGDPVGLRAVVDNLLNHAVHHAGDADISMHVEGAHAVIEVQEASRNRDTGSTGFGFASMRGVVGLHGGEASLRNHPDGACRPGRASGMIHDDG